MTDPADQQATPLAFDKMALSAHAHGDGIGTLFSWQGKLLRGIRAEHAAFYRGLFETGLVDRLVKQGLLIASNTVEIQVPGHELVIEHQRVPFVTYPTEWCGAMLQAAAVATLDLQLELLKADATLDDAHAWNILYDGSKPVMVDLTAIEPRTTDGRWRAEQDFRFCMMYPALLAARGRADFGRLLTDTLTVRDCDITALLPYALSARVRHLIWRVRHRLGLTPHTADALIRRITALRKRIATLRMPTTAPPPADHLQDTWLTEQVRTLAPATALAVGCSTGAIPAALAHAGVKVLACDPNEPATDALFDFARRKTLDILPLITDVFATASTFGTFDRAAGPVTRRLGCELAVHAITRPKADPVDQARFDQRVQALAAFAGKYVLVRITEAAKGKSGGGLSDQEIAGLLQRHARTVTRLEGGGPGVWYHCVK